MTPMETAAPRFPLTTHMSQPQIHLRPRFREHTLLDPETYHRRAQVWSSLSHVQRNTQFRIQCLFEANFDSNLSIDGVQLAQWSGTQSGTFSTPVSLGQHTLKWTYVKDGSVSSGSDAAWIDDVTIPLANQLRKCKLAQSIIALTTATGSTETFLTVLNPYSLLNNPRSTWQPAIWPHPLIPSRGSMSRISDLTGLCLARRRWMGHYRPLRSSQRHQTYQRSWLEFQPRC